MTHGGTAMITETTTCRPQKGYLIAFEGIDGTGKSTQLLMLAQTLQKQGYDIITTREPTDSRYGQKIRELYADRDSVSRQEELELFIQDRKEHVATLIAPQLAAGKIVLCDRYFLSTIAYQGAQGMEINDIEEKNNFAPRPDIALLFQVAPEISIARITEKRGETLNDFEQLDSLRRVDSIFSSLQYDYIRRIDANRPVDVVHREIQGIITTLLSNRPAHHETK